MIECVVRMKNPDDCLKCGVRHICNPYVDYWQQDTRKKPKPGQKGCLIICQLPEGHGRLVDKDEMLKKMENYHRYMTVGRESDPRCIIEDSPTIVPATETEATPCP